MSTELPSHHRADGGFRNPWPGIAPQHFSGVLKWLLWDRLIHPLAKDPPASTFPIVASAFVAPRAQPDALSVTWVGHSTSLIQLGATNIITDPIWSDRASPFSFAGPRRLIPPAFRLDALPPIDIVLISHNHYDHLDDRTVRVLIAHHPKATWVTPLGLASFVRERGAHSVVELDWWQAIEINGVTVTCTPAQHGSARGLRDRNRTLWCSWCVRLDDRAVFFGGDTAYHPELATIAKRCGPFDVAMLPIGAYEPRWFMKPVHMNPEEAVRAYQDIVGASENPRRIHFMPIHWGTFRLADDALDAPRERLIAEWRRVGLATDALWLMRHGETRYITAAK